MSQIDASGHAPAGQQSPPGAGRDDVYLVGVDAGSQSAKVVIFTADGQPVARGDQPLSPMLRPRHGVVVHPDDDVWAAICAASRQAMAGFVAAGGEPSRIAGIGLCPIRCCKAFLHADGRLAEPVISWMDDRAYQPYRPTGDWRVATTLSGYIAHRCTGRFADTVANNIDMQWPVDAENWAWSTDPAVAVRFALHADELVELQMPGEVIGPLTPAAAAETGLPAGVPVVQTANDKAVEMLGAGPLGSDTVLVSLGTYICSMTTGDRNVASAEHFWTNFASVPGRYLYESTGVRRGMWTVSWFLDLLGPEVAAAARTAGLSREQYLEREASAVTAGSDGVLTVLDWLAPTDHPTRKGSWLGFDARHTRGHLYRSILEAIALEMYGHARRMTGELQRPIARLVLSGGGARSDLFTGIFAAAFDCTTDRPVDGGGGAALGAAMCAAAGAGVYDDVPAASVAMAPRLESFTPEPVAAAMYRRVGALLPELRPATDPLYQRSYPIFH